MAGINFPASMYSPEYLQMHRRALRNTVYGTGNVVKADIENGKVVFIHNATGIKHATAREAFDAANVMGMTSFTKLTGEMRDATGNLRGMSGFNQRVSNMKEMLRNDSDLLNRFNQGLENKSLSRAEDLFFTIEEGRVPQGMLKTAKNLLKNVSEGRGLMFKTKDSGTFIKAFIKDGDKNIELTSVELNRLFNLTSDGAGGIFSNNGILSAMSKGDLGGLFQKAAKRGKGIFSLDGISLAGNDLSSIIKSSLGEEKTFAQAIKVFDTEQDLSKIALSYIDNFSAGVDNESIVSQAMRGASKQEIDEAVAFYARSGAVQSTIDSMERLGIISLNDSGIASTLSENSNIVEVLRGNLSIDNLTESQKQLHKELMNTFQRPYDGSTIINQKFVTSMRSNMQAEITSLEVAQQTRELTTAEYDRIKELKGYMQLSRDGMDADTIRFFFTDADKKVQLIKGVGTSGDISEALKGYAVITAKTNLKSELGIAAGSDMANIVMQGEGAGRVYLDPLAPAFHGEIFSSEEALEATRRRNARILNSYEKALDDGIFDPSLKKEIYRSADMSLEGLPTEIRAIQERSKMFAQGLRDAIESGVDIRSTPQLSNYLQNYVQSLMVREKNGMLLPVMEDTFRMSVDTELAYYSGRKTVGDSASLKAVTNLRLSGEADAGKIGLMNFKVRGHKMLMSGDAANIFHHSLGTFDLDDKGIPIMRTMKIFGDDGAEIGERIGFFTFRQPTGPGEYILSMADFDTETLRATFGKNEGLVSHLNNIVNQGTDNELFKTLQKIMSAEDMSPKKFEEMDRMLASTLDSGLSGDAVKLGQGTIHNALLEIMQGAEEAGLYKKVALSSDILKDLAGKEYGSTLAMDKNLMAKLISSGTDAEKLTAAYNQGNIYKVFAESGAFTLEDQTINAFRATTLISNDQKSAIFAAAEAAQAEPEALAGTYTKKLLQGFSDLSQGGQNKPLMEFFSDTLIKEYNAKQLLAEELQDSLGNYINRLTLATAPTRQATDILSKLDSDVAARLMASHKVGLIAPSDAVDLATTMSLNNTIDSKGTLAHYTSSLASTIEGSINETLSRGGSASAVVDSLAKLAGKQQELMAGGNSVKILDMAGSLAVEEQGKFIGSVRAAAYKKGLTAAEDMLGIDEMILKHRAKGGDIRTLVDGIISGFKTEFGDELAEANDLATSFIRSMEGVSKARTNDEVQAALIRVMGISSGKYAGATAGSRIAQEGYTALRRIGLSKSGSRLQPFMSEAVLSAKGGEAADSIDQMHNLLRTQFANVLSDTDELANMVNYESHLASQYIGDQLHKGILTAAQEKGTTVQEVIDNLDFMSGSRKGPSIDRYLTAGEDPNELSKLFRGARDARAMSYYKKQDNLMSLVDQYDQFKNMDKEAQAVVKQDIINSYNRFKASSDFMKSDDARLAEAVMLGDEGFDKASLGLTEEQNRIATQIRRASDTRARLTPEIEDMLGRRGDAIDFVPPGLDDELRSTLSKSEDIADASSTAVGRNYKRIGEAFSEGGAMNKVMQNPGIRKAGYAGLGIIAASFLYSRNKDRTQDDVSGPPLLPGGSAYEDMPRRAPQIPEGSMFSGYQQGTSYSINIQGSSDQINNFRSAAGSVAGGSMNSTMYKGLPRLGSNPYSEVASSY